MRGSEKINPSKYIKKPLWEIYPGVAFFIFWEKYTIALVLIAVVFPFFLEKYTSIKLPFINQIFTKNTHYLLFLNMLIKINNEIKTIAL